MQDRPLVRTVSDPEPIDYDCYATYEDGATLVICDRRNPAAWIRAAPAATTTVDP